jgi:hypothetical protein
MNAENMSSKELVESLRETYSSYSPTELVWFMFEQASGREYTEAVEALESLGCQRPSREKLEKYTILKEITREYPLKSREYTKASEAMSTMTKSGEARDEKEKREGAEKAEGERARQNHSKKYTLLRENSPNLDRKITETNREVGYAQDERVRISRAIYSKCERFASSTGHYMTRGQRADKLHRSTLEEDMDARDAENWHMRAVGIYGKWNGIAHNWADKLNLEEAKVTNLDEILELGPKDK